jgi:hypothetical protein
MASIKRTTVPVQQAAPGRIQSDRTWTPKKPPFTPRREYAFMRQLGLITCTQGPGGPFGPFDGGVQQ